MKPITVSRASKIPIGKLSGMARVKIETIRYYERIGLMPKPSRTEGGHRLYDHDHCKRLTFIRRGRELGFAIEDIRKLLELAKGTQPCATVQTVTRNHLGTIRAKIADLQRLEETLAEIAERCADGTTPACPIIDALFEGIDDSGMSSEQT